MRIIPPFCWCDGSFGDDDRWTVATRDHRRLRRLRSCFTAFFDTIQKPTMQGCLLVLHRIRHADLTTRAILYSPYIKSPLISRKTHKNWALKKLRSTLKILLLPIIFKNYACDGDKLRFDRFKNRSSFSIKSQNLF